MRVSISSNNFNPTPFPKKESLYVSYSYIDVCHDEEHNTSI